MTTAHPIPRECLRQHVAVLGKTGSGKTYAAKGMVEQLIRENARVCILDPTGAWWGLRLEADGKGRGLPVVILGGDHADVPINESAGAAVGEMVATQQMQVIVDLSRTTLGERRRFVEHFAERVFEKNRGVLHLVIDEADEFAPQSPPPGTERMLGAIDRIVRRGRLKGFRVMMITQRPAVLNKNVLTQANTLVAMRLPASQDRKAIELWIKGQADEAKAAGLLGSLASLKRGEGWIWAPEQGVLSRHVFPSIRTFDSSRTPEDGETVGSVQLGELNLEGVKAALAESIEKAKADDPELLRAEIKRLSQQAQAAGKDKHAEAEQARAIADLQDELKAERRRTQQATEALEATSAAFQSLGEAMTKAHAALTTPDLRLSPRAVAFPEKVTVRAEPSVIPFRPSQEAMRAAFREDATPLAKTNGTHQQTAPRNLEKGPGLVLDAVAWWSAIGQLTPTRAMVAAVSGYSVAGGSFARYCSTLRSMGLVAGDNGRLSLTALGMMSAALPDTPPTAAELQRRVLEVLDSGPRKILKVLLEKGEELGRTELGERAGYEASGGSFARYCSTLRSLELITYPRKTTAKASAWLLGEAE